MQTMHPSVKPSGNIWKCAVFLAAVLVAGGSFCAGQLQLTARTAAHPIAIDGETSEQDYVEALWSRRFEVLEPEDPNVNGLYLAVERL